MRMLTFRTLRAPGVEAAAATAEAGGTASQKDSSNIVLFPPQAIFSTLTTMGWLGWIFTQIFNQGQHAHI